MNKTHYYPVDLIRFFAAFFVMLAHYLNVSGILLWHINSIGQLGVHVFFIISGFVISITAERSSSTQFLMRRAIRLYPALILCLTLSTAVIFAATYSGLKIPELVTVPSFTDFLVNISLMNKIFMSRHYIDVVLWTIAVEVKFYILVAFALVFTKKMERFMVIYSLVSIVALVIKNFDTSNVLINWGVFFAAGSNFYYIKKHGYSPIRALLNMLYLVVASLHIWFNFYEPKTIAVCVFIVLYVLMGVLITANTGTKIITPTVSRILIAMGGMSYPLYLIHNAVGRILIHNHILSMIPMMVVALLASYCILQCEIFIRSKLIH